MAPRSVATALSLARDGACLVPLAAQSLLPDLEQLSATQPVSQAGVRLVDNALVRSLTQTGAPLHALASEVLGPAARRVRALWLNKSKDANWALGWHQDRTIAVRARHDVTGYGPWTVKSGVPHVAPPVALLERMMTMRVHLDTVDECNAPLLVAPGSHRVGRIDEASIAEIVSRCGVTSCLAARGDVRLYATPILHASERASAGRQRRVLQIDFAAEDLPPPLEWFGV